MIIIRSVAWLANQMHQYAFWRAISLKRKDKLFLDTNPFYYDTREYELGIFTIEENIATNKERPWYVRLWKNTFLDKLRYPLNFLCRKLDPHYIIENPLHPKVHTKMFDYNPEVEQKVLNSWGDFYLEWFWHSEKYFAWYEDVIRKDFTLKEPISDPKNLAVIQQMQNTQSVSLHVRRTDYIALGYKLCDMQYYEDAIAYIQKNVNNPEFFIFSDDVERCKEAFKAYPITAFIDRNTGKESYKDMMLMAQCKHNIIANSTFSRRGARLNENPEKIVIAPAQRHKSIDYADMVPENRIRL